MCKDSRLPLTLVPRQALICGKQLAKAGMVYWSGTGVPPVIHGQDAHATLSKHYNTDAATLQWFASQVAQLP